MLVQIECSQFHKIGVQTTHVPSSEIPKRDSGSHVSKSGLNPHKIVRIMLDDTSKQRLMHEYVGKHAKRMHRSKESQTGGVKQAWQATSHRAKRGYASRKLESRGCASQVVTPQQSTRGLDITIEEQSHGEHKAWQNLDLERQAQK